VAERFRFLLRPRWILSHLLVLLLIFTMINLGFWQLRRLHERRDHNALITGRSDQPVVPVNNLLRPTSDHDALEAARYRSVSATGTYDDAGTVVVRNRSEGGVPGAWLVTPLRIAPGESVGIVRGFVGFEANGSIVRAPAPKGVVTDRGLVVDPHRFDGTAPKDLKPFLARLAAGETHQAARRFRHGLVAPRQCQLRILKALDRFLGEGNLDDDLSVDRGGLDLVTEVLPIDVLVRTVQGKVIGIGRCTPRRDTSYEHRDEKHGVLQE